MPAATRPASPPGTADPDEVAKFDRLAAGWWDPRGPMAPLHAMNPLRTGWVARRLEDLPGRRPGVGAPLAGLTLLDVGCGAGLAAEAFARMGAAVTGIDAAPAALAAARAHAAAEGLAVDYRVESPETLAASGARFDAVVAFEVVEHVAPGPARDAFLAALAALARPGGRVFLSTLNRTPASWLLAKVGAELVLRWLPRGTHDWRAFPTPGELGAGLRRAGLLVGDAAGMRFDLPARRWRESRDLGVNYLMAADRPA